MSELLEKPAYGSPCNGCGLCCIAVQCPVSTAMFGEQEVCPALTQAGQSFACGLMIDTRQYVPDMTAWGGKTLTEAFSLMIGSGLGCDGTLEGEEPTPEQRASLHERANAKIAAASEEAQILLAYFREPTP